MSNTAYPLHSPSWVNAKSMLLKHITSNNTILHERCSSNLESPLVRNIWIIYILFHSLICFRLRHIVKKLQKDDISKEDLIKNLEYAASVLETVYIDETRSDIPFFKRVSYNKFIKLSRFIICTEVGCLKCRQFLWFLILLFRQTQPR